MKFSRGIQRVMRLFLFVSHAFPVLFCPIMSLGEHVVPGTFVMAFYSSAVIDIFIYRNACQVYFCYKVGKHQEIFY